MERTWIKIGEKEIPEEEEDSETVRRNIDQEIENFVNSISDLWKDDPLDGDETEEISQKILVELNHVNGNE